MKTPRGLNLSEAIKFMKAEHAKMQREERGSFDSTLDTDSLVELGYRMAIADLEACTRKVEK